MDITLDISRRNSDNAHVPLTEPYASAFRLIDGLRCAPGAVYQGVRFTRETQSRLGYWPWLVDVQTPEWAVIREAGGGAVRVSTTLLDGLVAQADEIEQIIAHAKASTAPITYRCRAARCQARVSLRGSLCARCAHDDE